MRRLVLCALMSASLAGVPMLAGCEDTLEQKSSTEVKDDGTVVKEEKKTVENPDGSVTKTEEKKVDKPDGK